MLAIQAIESVVNVLQVQNLLALTADYIVERVLRCAAVLAARCRG